MWYFWDDNFIQDEVLYDGNLLWFNKLQPVGCNRVSPVCSVLVYTICIVLSVMIFLHNDHNNRFSSQYITPPLYSHLGNESVRKTTFYGLAIALTKSEKGKRQFEGTL